ncbi:MAG TPA: nucleotide exchange factor GrpE [Symbiobacteriaceae bacterium]|nr:nucleotide exchange factor GrpE [Symbiobacteriaceae bacterium]
MNEETKKPDPQDLTGDGLGDATSDGPATPYGADELEQTRARVAELENRLLRSQADYENFKRRVQREKEDLAIYANQKLILNLLPVLDNLERALAAPKVEGDEKLRQGVEMTARSFRDILGREGVTPIEAVGQRFDPNLHEALMTVDSPDHEDDVVVMEFEKGYSLGDRVIRPSRVQVCKKG